MAEMETLIYLKDLLKKLSLDKLDQFEVLALCDKLTVNHSEVTSFSKQKYSLQKEVLEQIMKVETSEFYARILEETKMHVKEQKNNSYLCCLVGCCFKTGQHTFYLRHLKQVHSTNDNLKCNFKHNCARRFSSIPLLIDHIKEIHSNVRNSSQQVLPETLVNIPCCCDMVSCGGATFRTVENLMTHINVNHSEEDRQCIFEGCVTVFKRGGESRHHFRLKHKKTKLRIEN